MQLEAARRRVDLYLSPSVANRGSWTPISSVAHVQVTVGQGGTFDIPLAIATDLGSYDVIADGDCDGMYSPLADSITSFTVFQPQDLDGNCYAGETFFTSEECMHSPVDCACAASAHCAQGNQNGNTYYYCEGNRGGSHGKMRVVQQDRN